LFAAFVAKNPEISQCHGQILTYYQMRNRLNHTITQLKCNVTKVTALWSSGISSTVHIQRENLEE